MKSWLCRVVAFLSAGAAAQAASLVLEFDAQTAGLTPGNRVASLPTAGSAGCTFSPVVLGQGPTYYGAYYGPKAFVFDGSENSAMTGNTPPSAICGGNAWSWEVWVCNPSLDAGIESVFGWTKRDSWVDGNAGNSCMEFRYGSDGGNAVEHYGGNVTWGGGVPAVGEWHHVACVYDGSTESLYVDGTLRERRSNSLRVRGDGAFYLGAVQQMENQPAWAWPFSGGIGKLSIYAGEITAGKILADYNAEHVTYQQYATPSLAVWAGAAGQALPWGAPQNWLMGVVGGVGSDRVFIENGGIAEVTSAVDTLRSLSVKDGGLVLDSGAEMTLLDDATLGSGAGNAFSLTIREGSLVASNLVRTGFNGADSTLVIGGGQGPASLWIRDANFGRGHDQLLEGNGTTSMIISNNGTVTVREGWAQLGRYAGGAASLTVEQGGTFNYLGSDSFVVGAVAADAVVTMNGGAMNFPYPARLMMSEGDGTAAAYLNGGTLSVRQIFDNGASASAIYFNGTVLTSPSSDGIGNYFQNMKNLWLMPGNAILDVPNDWTMSVYTPFMDAPSTSGGIVKLGTGYLRLYGENDFTGPITVDGGGLFLQGENPLPDTYAGSVSVANGAIVALQRDGGAGQLAALMDLLSVGRIGLYATNATDTIDLSQLPYVTLEPLENFPFEGILYPYDNLFTVDLANDFTFAGTLVDLPGTPGRIWLPAGTSPNRVLTLASSNDISGLVLVEGGILQVEHPDALGSGPITLRNGASLCLESAQISNPVAAGIIARITADSYGSILLGPSCAALNISLAGLTGVYVGARPTTLAYAGTLTPDGTTYRFGGGLQDWYGGERGLEVNWLADAGGSVTRGVEVGLPGMVYLQGNNSYSGKTLIKDGGTVYLFEDSGLGTPPPSPVAGHLTLDGGILRVGGSAKIELNANRGVTIGPNGGTFHNWGGSYINIWGALAGAGTLSLTDSGGTALFSGANTFTGSIFFDLERNGMSYLTIGTGTDFSWVSQQPIYGVGNGGWLTLNNSAAAMFPSPLQGAVGLTKVGGGTLTMAAGHNTYTFGTRIENGTLKAAADGVIPHGEGRRSLQLFAPAFLDVDGRDVTLNGLSGAGSLLNAAGNATVLSVGDGNENSVFAGGLAPQMTYRKIGSGLHADFGTDAMASLLVEGGTLMVGDLRRLQGPPLLTGDGTLSLKTFNGLSGDFVDQGFVPTGWDANKSVHIETLSELDNLFGNASGAVHVDSATLGPYFDYGNIAQFFPGKYADGGTENFVARWHGKFYAPVSGDYTFATASDDGSVIYLDGNKIVDNNFLQGWGEVGNPNRRGGVVWLAKGHHDIVIGFFESGGAQGLTVWCGLAPNMGWDAVGRMPQMYLESDEPLTPDGILANTLATPITGGADTWIEKVGLIPLTVASDNSVTFGGTWAVRSGEARVVDGGAFGGKGAVVDAGATFTFDLSGNLTYGGNVSGKGALRHAGAGTLTLTGRNTYTGGTVIDQGTLRVEAPGTLGGGTLVVNGTLELAFSGVVKQSDVMAVTTATGSGEIVLLSGTLIADTMTSTVPVRVMPGAQYIAATPNANVITLEGGEGSFGNRDVQLIGLDDPSLWQLNGFAQWVSPGVARVSQAVPDTGTGTLLLKEQINAVLPWDISFTYTMAGTTSGENPADGFSWFIHSRADGPSAIGGGATGSGVSDIRTAFGFILQVYPHCDPFFRFCWVEDGYILNDTKVADLNGIEPRWGDTQVRVTHDGAGLVTVTLTQGGNVYTDTRQIDIAAKLGGLMGWLGFGGGIGGCNADQQVSALRACVSLPKVTSLADDNAWIFNGSARLVSQDTVQLTPRSGGAGTMYLSEKVDLSRMWRLSFRYDIFDKQNDNADGFSVFLHNDPSGSTAIGGGGGGRGHSGISPQVGYTLNIFGQNYIDWITDGNEGGARANNPNGIIPANGALYVELISDGAGQLTLRARQGGNTWTTTRTVDLETALGAADAWLGISGATGGVTADQRVSELAFTYWNADYLYPAYSVSVNVEASNSGNSTLYGSYVPTDANADTLTLNNGAALDIQPNPLRVADTPYTVAFQNVVLHGASSVAVHNNGTGAGLLAFANLYVENKSVVTITGNIAFPGNTLTIHAPVDMPPGFHLIADLTGAAGWDSNTVFALDPVDSPPRAKLTFRNGKLYLNHIQGTIMILR